MNQTSTVAEVIEALDTMPNDVTDWEANFLESVKKQRWPLSRKQYAILVTMAEQYLDPGLAAELRGQQRFERNGSTWQG